MTELTQTEIDELEGKWFRLGWNAALREVILVEESPNWESGVEFARGQLMDHSKK